MGLRLTLPYPPDEPGTLVAGALPASAGNVLDSGRTWSDTGMGELVLTSLGLIACDLDTLEMAGVGWTSFDAASQLSDLGTYASIAMHVEGCGTLSFGIDHRLAANIWAIASQLSEAGGDVEIEGVVTSPGISALIAPTPAPPAPPAPPRRTASAATAVLSVDDAATGFDTPSFEAPSFEATSFEPDWPPPPFDPGAEAEVDPGVGFDVDTSSGDGDALAADPGSPPSGPADDAPEWTTWREDSRPEAGEPGSAPPGAEAELPAPDGAPVEDASAATAATTTTTNNNNNTAATARLGGARGRSLFDDTETVRTSSPVAGSLGHRDQLAAVQTEVDERFTAYAASLDESDRPSRRRTWLLGGSVAAVALALIAAGMAFWPSGDSGDSVAAGGSTTTAATTGQSLGSEAAIAPDPTEPASTGVAGAPQAPATASTVAPVSPVSAVPTASTVAAVGQPGPSQPVVAQTVPTVGTGRCHPAYLPCLPDLPGDALDCDDLTSAQRPVRLLDRAKDPYQLQGNKPTGVACQTS